MIDVLLDGWSLVYKPDSPSALHLMTLISNRPSSIHYTIAIPNKPPDWFPQDIQVIESPTADSKWGQLLWEQRVLPGLANRSVADLLHLTTATPPLVSSLPVALSPSDYPRQPRRGGVIDRLRVALASGGMSRISALIWPSDLPSPPDLDIRVYTLPPIAQTNFFAAEVVPGDLLEGRDLPETYILYQGPVDRATVNRLLDVWTWADGPIGEYYPLLIAGLEQNVSNRTMDEARLRFGINTNIQVLPPLSPHTLSLIYHRSTAVFNLGDISVWGNAARNALACAKPFVAAFNTDIESVVGPAAYLVPGGNARSLGAALITVVVEDSLAEQLSNAARERSSAWDSSKFSDVLEDVYKNVSLH